MQGFPHFFCYSIIKTLSWWFWRSAMSLKSATCSKFVAHEDAILSHLGWALILLSWRHHLKLNLHFSISTSVKYWDSRQQKHSLKLWIPHHWNSYFLGVTWRLSLDLFHMHFEKYFRLLFENLPAQGLIQIFANLLLWLLSDQKLQHSEARRKGVCTFLFLWEVSTAVLRRKTTHGWFFEN